MTYTPPTGYTLIPGTGHQSVAQALLAAAVTAGVTVNQITWSADHGGWIVPTALANVYVAPDTFAITHEDDAPLSIHLDEDGVPYFGN